MQQSCKVMNADQALATSETKDVFSVVDIEQLLDSDMVEEEKKQQKTPDQDHMVSSSLL